MRFYEVLAASLVAPFVAAHGGTPGAPKIFGLARDVADLKTRNIFGGHNHRAAGHGSPLQARQGGADGRCGKDFGCATCDEGYCCSPGGYCGKGQDYCQAPDSQFDYGPGADANKLPSGGSTRNIARTKLGSVPYGGEGIYVCEKAGQIAITYDDGPYIYTNDLLDMFKSYNFKATFFMTGINLYKGAIDDASTKWPAMMQRMVTDGHQLASHTWSHQDLSAITSAQRYEQMIKLEMAMSNVVGKFPTYMRPPYSSCSEASGCQKDMADLGYHVSYFDLDTDDYNNVTPDKAQIPKDNVKKALDAKNSATDDFLAIAHDIHYQTVHNLTGYMLDLMVKKGYKGVTMGECLGDPEANWYRSSGSGRVATSSVFTPPACASTRASSSVAASRTSSGVVATPTGVSQDSSCGSAVGLTCLGFDQGECCSQPLRYWMSKRFWQVRFIVGLVFGRCFVCCLFCERSAIKLCFNPCRLVRKRTAIKLCITPCCFDGRVVEHYLLCRSFFFCPIKLHRQAEHHYPNIDPRVLQTDTKPHPRSCGLTQRHVWWL
ncbi:hypothetical protein SNOG_09529 [Parastagonospora nodorum SN15]|uniref:NodB homology domain-containing protein n=1 Tax=Phaeosphaeria nodorum (strain SN15 / ATCC MYA-4574 / FGSC 10173) TaxID=321614 RepID=Q0UFD5_PHANO|nr:hypothetical protein SNOG_09529 [Parastagonospora nodorum SN15]EAT82794.2 hypothetical protein SNOG_09529 [Parastagonospora nodorum SN15]